ncbi:major facilitator superfamily transporter [Purpureocillium lavendulum]|uniref:Major facilitator superfamily transporter n=1 Tax=Purpureocillium lavendulum TaxID=1247861 RepID=A0AB34G5U1_9HYPO|nr:major facilitator superfamily transporter [Purpureocillium lavendulum]
MAGKPPSPGSGSSSPASFYTANDSDEQLESTTASSPAHASPCPYRDARRLPRELKDHCQIFLEEQLYTCAINLFNSSLGSGVSRRDVSQQSRKGVAVPPPSHIALLNTLIVHPMNTTRAEKPDHLDMPALALDYLRSLLAVVGPVNAGFRAAFQFRPQPRWGRRSGYASNGSDSDMSDGEGRDHDRLRGRMANEASVWCRGQDFWSTVGWAFNTATLYPHRWRYWKVWLEYMVDVLWADWEERERIDHEAHHAKGEPDADDAPLASRRQSIIVMYMDQQEGRQSGFKRIIKALLADGGSLSTSSFTEVFEKEHRGAKKASRKRKREQVLDLENDKFGDYFDDDSISSGVSEPPTPQKPRDGRKEVSFGCSHPGLAESVVLRLRLFKLVSAAVHAVRKNHELNLLYEEFAAAVQVLPPQMFALLVTQRTNPLLDISHVTLAKELFDRLLPPSYTKPWKVDPDEDAAGRLTMPMLERCYVTLPAQTVGLEDNAKLSLVVENAILLMWKCDMLEYTDAFSAAVDKGIKAREAKAKKKRTGRMKTDSGDAAAQEMLSGSAERIRVLMQVLEASATA